MRKLVEIAVGQMDSRRIPTNGEVQTLLLHEYFEEQMYDNSGIDVGGIDASEMYNLNLAAVRESVWVASGWLYITRIQ